MDAKLSYLFAVLGGIILVTIGLCINKEEARTLNKYSTIGLGICFIVMGVLFLIFG